MKHHVVVSKKSKEHINAEVKRRNRHSSIRHNQQSVADEIIMEWEENRKQSQ